MASYKKYAEDLIGNWETGQYAPQKSVTQDVYQTNWNKLSNDFNTLKDKLARNFNNAQMEYTNTLNDIQNQSFNRMRNADIDLASRGLSNSGVGNLVTQADTQSKGADVESALSSLLDTNSASIEGLTQGVTNLGQQQSSLAGKLAGDLGNITDQEAANAQQYANLVAGIGEGAAQRAASRAGSGRSKKSQEEELNDEIKRRLLIADTIASKDLSDDEKQKYLYEYLDVPSDVAASVVKGYNDNIALQNTRKQLQNYNKTRATLNKASDTWSKVANYLPGLGTKATAKLFNIPNAINYWGEQFTGRPLQNRLNNLSYTDIYDLLYGDE